MNDQSTSRRFYILDPLRLLAAFAVLIYHYSIYFDPSDKLINGISRFGYLGVDFFFLLSGFVIMASAQNRGAFEFAFARALRIYPAFIVCLVLTVLVIYFVSGTTLPIGNVIANATILNDYLRIPNVDGVYWTLQAEIKFYFCVFILLLTGIFSYHRYWIVIWLLIAIIYYFCKQPFFMGWFINPSYSFYFIAGVSAYLLSQSSQNWNAQFCFWVSTLFCVLVAGDQAKNFLSSPSAVDILTIRVIVTFFCLFFFVLAFGFMNIKRVPHWWMYLGAVSYPLYLLHNRVGKAIIDRFDGANHSYPLLVSVSFGIVLLAFLVNRYVETPIDGVGKIFLRKMKRKAETIEPLSE